MRNMNTQRHGLVRMFWLRGFSTDLNGKWTLRNHTKSYSGNLILVCTGQYSQPKLHDAHIKIHKLWNGSYLPCTNLKSQLIKHQLCTFGEYIKPSLFIGDNDVKRYKTVEYNPLLYRDGVIILVIDKLNAQMISLLYSSTCFEHYVFINRRSKLHYTASVIITLCRWPCGAPVHRTATCRVWWYQGASDSHLQSVVIPRCIGRPPSECGDTRCCIIQFWPPGDEHIVLETCRGI